MALPLLLAASQARAQSAEVQRLDSDVARAMRDWHVPGLAVAVVQGDRVLLAKGYGVRALGRPEPVDTATRFAIGSTTKAMTVVALGMLVDEGKVRWDDPVTKYVPSFRLADPYATRALTVRDLLTHRAGLGNADLLWTGADYEPAEIFRRVGTLPAAYPFRAGFVYQNIMYALAGEVVRVGSGLSWDDFVRTRIFTPLGMRSTVTRLTALAGRGDVASPHMVIDDTLRVIPNRPVDPVAPAGAVWSSVSDMARWMRFVLDSGRADGRPLLSIASWREMLTPQVVADTAMYPALAASRPHFFTYGLGWFLQDYGGQMVAMHTGSIDGMSAIIGLIPERRLGVYVLANADHAELRHAIMYEVFDLFGRGDAGGGVQATSAGAPRDWSGELRRLYAERATRARAAERQIEASRPAGTHPSLPLARYAGRYTSETFGTVGVRLRGDTLHLQLGRAFDGDLAHWAFDAFMARWADRRNGSSLVVFHPNGSGGVASVTVDDVTFARDADAP